jgi:hypothetical protein
VENQRDYRNAVDSAQERADRLAPGDLRLEASRLAAANRRIREERIPRLLTNASMSDAARTGRLRDTRREYWFNAATIEGNRRALRERGQGTGE